MRGRWPRHLNGNRKANSADDQPHILVNVQSAPLTRTSGRIFIPHYIDPETDRSALLSEVGDLITAMITDGPRSIDKDYLDALPR